MKRLVYDTESDGFVQDLTRIHCLEAEDPDTGQTFSFGPKNIHEGVELLEKADVIYAHNGLKHDERAIKKVFPKFKPKKCRDTLIMSRLFHPDIKREMDFALQAKKILPGKYMGRHSLASWGYRLGEFKGDYVEWFKEKFGKDANPFAEWCPEMQDYCGQDKKIAAIMLRRFEKYGWPDDCVELEHQVAAIIHQQEENGFYFDIDGAGHIYAQLSARRQEIGEQLIDAFGSWWERGETVTPKIGDHLKTYKSIYTVKDAPYTKIKRVQFNPSSRSHIVKRLIGKYDWQPETWTESGDPEVDEAVLAKLPYPEAKQLSEHFLLDKRIGQLAEGNQAWLKLVKPDHRIHGTLITNGTPTGRATHSNPNMSQVPTHAKPYGKEFRGLFTVPAGKALVGIDVSGLELRMLAHYLARYDGGEFAKIVCEGDIHTENWKAEPRHIKSRQMAKPVIYGMIYGAQDPKLGEIVGKGREAGADIRKALYARYPGLDTITKAAQHAAKTRGYIIGLDGRHMPIRSPHSALNTLLQGGGGVVTKQWIVYTHEDFKSAGLADQVAQVAWSHDEIQVEADDADVAHAAGKISVAAIARAAERLKVRCPLTGEFKVGRTWADTH